MNTPVLWLDKSLFDLSPFEIISKPTHFDIAIDNRLRLGNYVERFAFFELRSHKNITILAENIQIQDGKTTLGELDCLFKKDQQATHLEIVYKFYLYDGSVGESEIDHFIGPNRKDTLVAKLSKLKNKQLPLLHSKACQNYLKSLELNSEDLAQKVYFKAQLFLPLEQQNITLNKINPECVYGFYISWNKINQFDSCKFYIPNKKDWLITPHPNVNWMSFKTFKKEAESDINDRFSPMVWIKSKNGELQKCFVVWW